MDRHSAHVDDDQLIALVNDLLTSGQREALLSHLRRCEECERRFTDFAALHESALASTPRGEDLTAGARPITVRAPSNTRRLLAGVVVAAAVLLVVFMPRRVVDVEDPLDYWLPVDQEMALLRSDERADELHSLRIAMEAYGRRDVDGALTLFEKAKMPDANDTWRSLRDLYLASTYIHNSRYDEALTILAAVDIPTLPSPWWERATWMTYIVHRKKGRDAEASKVLKELLEVEGDIGARARAQAAGRADGSSPDRK